jgi:subtilase family serine protease
LVAVLIAVAVPVMLPVPAFKDSPNGRLGDTENVYGVNPPVAVTGVTADNTTSMVAVTVAVLKVVNSAGGADTVRLNVLLLVCPMLSVIVTVNTVCASVAVAVPDIRPVPVFNVNPVGRLGLIEKVSVP